MAKRMFRKKRRVVVAEPTDLFAPQRTELRRILNRGHHARDNSQVVIQEAGYWDTPSVQTWHLQTGKQLAYLEEILKKITPKSPNWPFPPTCPPPNYTELGQVFKTIVHQVETHTDDLLDFLEL